MISRGKINSAKKLVLYGPEGFGKSTFASKFPDPVFIDTEGSTKELDVARFDGDMTDWENIMSAVDHVIKNPDCCKTLVIDTADWAEGACIKYTVSHGGSNIKGIEDFGYGKGYVYAMENFQNLLTKLSEVVSKGINVVITAHAQMRKFEQPDEMGAYDRWEMKLSKKDAPLLKEWADIVLFGNYKTYVIEDSKTKSKKAQGNKRVMYATHHPCWDAKNRHGLPDEMPFEYEQIAHLFNAELEQPKKKAAKKEEKPIETVPVEEPKTETKVETKTEEPEVIKKLRELMEKDGISSDRLEYAVATKGAYFTGVSFTEYDPEFIQNSLIDKWSGFVKYAKKFTEKEINLDEIPF